MLQMLGLGLSCLTDYNMQIRLQFTRLYQDHKRQISMTL